LSLKVPWLWVSGFRLRLPWSVAHGDHPGAAGARVRIGTDHHGAGVRYRITKTDNSVIEVDNPSRWPAQTEIAKIEEPVILATILTNEEYVGASSSWWKRNAAGREF